MILSDNMRAAMFVALAMAVFTVNDALMKLAAPNLPFFQQIFMRGVIITIGLTGLAAYWGELRHTPCPRDRALILLRTASEAAGTVFFLLALFSMPIANLSAILQALPLTITLAAAIFLREAVGWKRIAAIIVGFIGVAIIIRPGTDGFTTHALYGVASVIAVTIRDLTSRRLSKAVPSSTVALSAAIGVSTMAGLGSLLNGEIWVMPSPRDTALLCGAALCLMVGYISSVAGMRLGEIGFVAPFRYCSLLVALILGLVIFGEWPDVWTMIGAGIVVATGLFTLYREHAAAQKVKHGLRMR